MATDFFEGRWEKRQACNDDAQQGLQNCHNTNLRETVGEILEIQVDRQYETDDGDSAYAADIDVSSTKPGDVYWGTYTKPRAKMTVSSSFLRVAICSPQTMGIGRRTMVRSMATLQLLRATIDAKILPQTPGRRGSQYLASGRQVNTSLMTMPTPKAMTRIRIAYAALRKLLFERNSVM